MSGFLAVCLFGTSQALAQSGGVTTISAQEQALLRSKDSAELTTVMPSSPPALSQAGMPDPQPGATVVTKPDAPPQAVMPPPPMPPRPTPPPPPTRAEKVPARPAPLPVVAEPQAVEAAPAPVTPKMDEAKRTRLWPMVLVGAVVVFLVSAALL